MNTENQDQPPPYDSVKQAVGHPQPVGYQPVSTWQQTTGYPQPVGYQPMPTAPPECSQTTGYQPYGAPGQVPYAQPAYQQTQFVQSPGQPVPTQVVLVQPGYQQPAVVTSVPQQTRPHDCIVPAILACLCCFWPTGIIAIYYASRTNTLLAEGNHREAQRASEKARNLVIASVVIGIICIALAVILRVTVRTRYHSYSYST